MIAVLGLGLGLLATPSAALAFGVTYYVMPRPATTYSTMG